MDNSQANIYGTRDGFFRRCPERVGGVLRQYALKKIECIQPQHNGQKIYIFPSPMLFYDVIFKILFNCALSLWLQSF